MLTVQQPVGVCGLITPWNFPLAMLARKVAPAIAAGCASVLKPAEDTPMSALAFAALCQDAGLPQGVLNVIPCRREDAATIGSVLCSSTAVAKLSFTGSTAVGKQLLAASAPTCKKVSLELGGNAPLIVFDDADVDAAVQGTLDCKFRFGGQTCVSANRVMVQAAVYEEYLASLAQRVAEMKVGDPLLDCTRLGPLINAQAVEKAQRLRQDAVGKGATALTGGEGALAHLGDELNSGHFHAPTVLAGVTGDMQCAQEEVFGPLAAVSSFDSEEEVVQRANDTRSGLAAYVYTKDMARSWRVSRAIQAGMVAVNDGILSSEAAPFGGVLESGLGREGGNGGIAEYMETKYIMMSSR
jgi:succinate-semialdehyde dehydrogenase/glutarate-semialdehyde dehydrogenase